MIKRRLGSALRARSYWSQCREIILRVITHNVMIVAADRFSTEQFEGDFSDRGHGEWLSRTRRSSQRVG